MGSIENPFLLPDHMKDSLIVEGLAEEFAASVDLVADLGAALNEARRERDRLTSILESEDGFDVLCKDQKIGRVELKHWIVRTIAFALADAFEIGLDSLSFTVNDPKQGDILVVVTQKGRAPSAVPEPSSPV